MARQDAPTSLALDTLIQDPEELAVLVKTLRDVPRHTVVILSLRYCALKSEACIELLAELAGEAWENEKLPSDKSPGPNLCLIETLYLRCMPRGGGAQDQCGLVRACATVQVQQGVATPQ